MANRLGKLQNLGLDLDVYATNNDKALPDVFAGFPRAQTLAPRPRPFLARVGK